MSELINIETYNDGINFVNSVFRKLYVDYPEPGSNEDPEIMLSCINIHKGSMGNYTTSLPIKTSNKIDQVPVFRVTPEGLEPVMIEPTPELQPEDEGYLPPYQKTIGGFDVWRELVFDNAFMPLKVAISDVMIREMKRKRNEPFTPMFYVE